MQYVKFFMGINIDTHTFYNMIILRYKRSNDLFEKIAVVTYGGNFSTFVFIMRYVVLANY